MVSETASMGTPTTTPFNCNHFNASRVTLTINGKEYSVRTNFATGEIAEGYNELVHNLGVFNRGFALNLVDYQGSNTIWAFDTTNSHNSGCSYISRPAPIATWIIKVEFELALIENVQLFVITKTEKTMAIDHNFSVEIRTV